jgi:hypothetical protein
MVVPVALGEYLTTLSISLVAICENGHTRFKSGENYVMVFARS